MPGDPDLDDVAFLSGKKKYNSSNENEFEIGAEVSGNRRNRHGVTVCSQKRALCVTGVVIGSLLLTALIIAFAGPSNDCSCDGNIYAKSSNNGQNDTEPVIPLATNGELFPWLEPHLPTFIQPLRYIVTIHPNLTTLEVKGQVTIDLTCEKDTNFLVLNIQDLNITERALVTSKGYSIKIIKILEHARRQQLYIEFKEKLKKKSNYTLNLRWYSKLNHEPDGFYVDEFITGDGNTRLLAATVIKRNSARKAFPCFDEAHIRTPFKVSVFRDRFHIGLSNSLVHGTDDVGFYMGSGLLRDDFVETPPVPADTIVWVVTDFQRESLSKSSLYQKMTTVQPFLSKLASYKKPNNTMSLNKSTKNITALTHSLNTLTFKTATTLSATKLQQSQVAINDSISNKNQTTKMNLQQAPSYTIYAPNDLLTRSSFVLHLSRDVLEYLQNWLETPYPLEKVDFVVLPSLNCDMISTLGLVFLKTTFLNNPQSITINEHHSAAAKISEAMIKQFFGGLTSPKHLKESWLWDGLVKYLCVLILAPLKKDWPVKERFLLRTSTAALDIDALHGWKSIANGTSSDGENENFYIDKAAAVISLLHSTIGDDVFRHCLGNFIKDNRYKTSEAGDMWNHCVSKADGMKNIKDMMNLWITQPGFPIVYATRKDGEVLIKQKEFEPSEFTVIHDTNYHGNNFTEPMKPINHTEKEIPHSKMKWIFPLSYITSAGNKTETIWLKNIELSIKIPKDIKWVKFNANQYGYFRVLYDDENWASLIDTLLKSHEVFSSKDRMGLISDSFTLCHANLMSCEMTMNLITYLPKEKNWGPMTTALKHLERWRRVLKYSECFLMLSEYVKKVLSIPINELQWEDQGTDEIRLLRAEILLASVLWEDTTSITRAKEIFDHHLSNESFIISPNLKEVIYTGAVLSGEYLYWQHCWNRFLSLRETTDDFGERMQLLRALGKTKDAWLQNRLLSHVTFLPTTEIIQVLEAISATSTGGAMACRFLQAKWFDLQFKLGEGSINFAKVISAITHNGATKFDYDELKSLVHRFGNGPGMEILNMTLKAVGANVEWVARAQISLYNWIIKYGHIER